MNKLSKEIYTKDGSLPRSDLRIPMPTGAKPPPQSAAKPSSETVYPRQNETKGTQDHFRKK